MARAMPQRYKNEDSKSFPNKWKNTDSKKTNNTNFSKLVNIRKNYLIREIALYEKKWRLAKRKYFKLEHQYQKVLIMKTR